MKRNFSIISLSIAVAIVFILGFSLSDTIERDPNSPKKGGPYELRGPALDNPLSPLSESFEGTTFPPAGWVRLSPLGNEGWNRQLSGTTPLPGWTGAGQITTPVGGGNACAYVTYGVVGANNNEWLITPQITNVQPTDSLKFWMRYIVPTYVDSFSVKISTTTQTIAAMTVPVLARRLSGAVDTGWTEYKFNIGSLVPAGSNIYIGFQESIINNIVNGSAITLDLVTVTAGSTPTTCTFSWISQTSGTIQALLSVSAVSDVIGWAGGNGPTVIRTTNGTTWSNATGTGIVGPVYNICGIDANTALCTTSPGATFIYRTTNGGTTWTQVHTATGTGAFINAIKMVDANTGYASGDPIAGVWELLKTTDGGVTWTQMPSAPTAPAGEAGWNNSFDVEGNNMWWLTNSATGKIYRSTNAGLNFTTHNAGFTTASYGSIKFAADGLNGIVTSNAGNSARSTDGGVTWTNATAIPGTGSSTGVETGLNAGNVDLFAVRGTGIQRSTNGGTNWTSVFTGTGAYNDINFATSAGCPVGWAVGAGGVVARMSLMTGISNYNGEVPSSFNLSQNFPNPFNPSTNINFSIPKSGLVTLKIYDMVGREVSTLVNEFKSAGNYIVGFSGANLTSGTYFYRLESDNFVETKKMLLIK